MNDILLTIAGIFAGIIAVVVILSIIAPKGYSIHRSIIINKPAPQVFDYIKYLRNQDNFSKWVMMDPGMRKTFKGTDGTEGFSYAWDSDMKQAGKGEQSIVKITDGQQVDTKVIFIKPFAGFADMSFITNAIADDSTKVEWQVTSKMAFPMNAILLFINMDKLLGADMDISLNNLKQILENNKS